MQKIEQKAIKFIDEKKLIAPGDKILVALSGGPDSVFLLNLLIKHKRRFKIEIALIHINHKLRGKDSTEDEKFCKLLAESLSIPIHIYRKDIKAFSKKNKISIEEAGREIRYSLFESTANKFGYTKIATAHNCSDNAETVFLNLIKGTGLKGISGIPEARGNIIRPILNVSKEDIISYLNKNEIKYRIDKSNYENDYERNFIRNEIFPLLKKRLNPALENSIFISSEVFKEIYLFVQKEMENFPEFSPKFFKDKLIFSVKALLSVKKEIRSEFLKRHFEKHFGFRPSFRDLKKILSIADKDTNEREELSQNFSVIKDRDEIIILSKSYSKAKNPSGSELEILPDDKNKILSITEINSVPPKYASNKMTEYISGDKASDKFILRKWKYGDRFFPLGLKGSKKISDFLNEQKISPLKKKDQFVLTNKGKIVWVVGIRIDDRFKITNSTKKVYMLCMN